MSCIRAKLKLELGRVYIQSTTGTINLISVHVDLSTTLVGRDLECAPSPSVPRLSSDGSHLESFLFPEELTR